MEGHLVFLISLLNRWNAIDLQEEEEFRTEELEVEEPYYEIGTLLWWRRVRRGRQLKKKYHNNVWSKIRIYNRIAQPFPQAHKSHYGCVNQQTMDAMYNI